MSKPEPHLYSITWSDPGPRTPDELKEGIFTFYHGDYDPEQGATPRPPRSRWLALLIGGVIYLGLFSAALLALSWVVAERVGLAPLGWLEAVLVAVAWATVKQCLVLADVRQ